MTPTDIEKLKSQAREIVERYKDLPMSMSEHEQLNRLRADIAAALEQARAGTGERDAVLVPREPTNAMLIAAMEDTLAHFKAEGIDRNSPFDDYPKPQEQLRRCWKAMIEAALLRSPSTEKTRP